MLVNATRNFKLTTSSIGYESLKFVVVVVVTKNHQTIKDTNVILWQTPETSQ